MVYFVFLLSDNESYIYHVTQSPILVQVASSLLVCAGQPRIHRRAAHLGGASTLSLQKTAGLTYILLNSVID